MGCRTKPDLPSGSNVDDCLPYFEYDRITHYRIEIRDDSVSEIAEKKGRSNFEEKLFSVLSDRYQGEKYAMTNLQDTAKMGELETLGFVKQEISKNEFYIFDKLFCERHYDEIEVNMCLPVYRDILIFKDHAKTVGFARICLDCDMSNIIGSAQTTVTFGQTGEFDALSHLLK
jgi:hypothetical protein